MNKLFPYAGSTSKYANIIAEIIRREMYDGPPVWTYSEPMIGSGAVYFELMPRTAFIGDINWLHTNLYWCLREDVEKVISHLASIVPIRDEFEGWQERLPIGIRNEFLTAAVWFFLMTTCYNGVLVYRDGKPYLTVGKRLDTWSEDLPRYIDKLRAAANQLQDANIYCADYQIMPQGDIAFIDPPWFGSKEDYGENFDHHRLAAWLRTLQGKWLLTINDCHQAREIYGAPHRPVAKWMKSLAPHYQVAPVAHGRRKSGEILYANFVPRMFGG